MSVAIEPGRYYMAFYALSLEVTSKLRGSKQPQVCSNLREGDIVSKSQWEKSQSTGDRVLELHQRGLVTWPRFQSKEEAAQGFEARSSDSRAFSLGDHMIFQAFLNVPEMLNLCE